MAGPNTILLKGELSERYGEALASVAVTPGHLIEFAADGSVKPHATAGGDAEPMVAIESFFTGGGVPGLAFTGGTIDDVYAINDRVRFIYGMENYEFYMFLATANNADPSKFLTSNGDGTLKVANGTTDANLFRAVESLNNTSGAKQRIRVRRK